MTTKVALASSFTHLQYLSRLSAFYSIAVMPVTTSRSVEIISRVRSGESVRKVASVLHIPLSTAYYHARDHCKKQSFMETEKLARKEQGYLLGMMVGDGSLIRHEGRGEFLSKIALDELRDQDIFRFVSSMFERTGKRVSVRVERRMFILRIWSKSFYNLVLAHMALEKRPSSRHHAKSLLGFKDWHRDFAVGFIGGLIDSDGHIERGRRGGHYGAIITTGSQPLRDQIVTLCKAHRISASWRVNHRGGHNEKPRYAVRISSKDLNSLCSEILCMKHLRCHGGPGRI